MKGLKAILSFFIITFLSATMIFAQETESEDEDTEAYSSSIIEASISILDPIFNFGDEIDGIRMSFNGGYYHPVGEGDQMYIGLSTSYSMIDRDVQLNVTAAGENVNDIANSNMLAIDLAMRYYANFSFLNIEPYIEANLGTRSFYTVTKAFFPDLDETVDRQSREFNIALGYGFSGGIHIYVGDQTALNLKTNFQFSNIAKYYSELEDNPNNPMPIDNFELQTSQTDFIRYDLGVSYFF